MLESCLLDPDLMDERTSATSSYVSSGQADFRHMVAARDGTCVMTGTGAPYMEACHVVPHAKGPEVCSDCLWNCSQSSFQASTLLILPIIGGKFLTHP